VPFQGWGGHIVIRKFDAARAGVLPFVVNCTRPGARDRSTTRS
jgi:hypothetical protein